MISQRKETATKAEGQDTSMEECDDEQTKQWKQQRKRNINTPTKAIGGNKALGSPRKKKEKTNKDQERNRFEALDDEMEEGAASSTGSPNEEC